MKWLFLKTKILNSYYQGLHNHKDSVFTTSTALFCPEMRKAPHNCSKNPLNAYENIQGIFYYLLFSIYYLACSFADFTMASEANK